MNKRSPLLPPQPLPPPHRWDRQAKVKVPLLAVFAVHVVVLSVLLIQGCRRSDRSSSEPEVAPTNETGLAPTNLPSDIQLVATNAPPPAPPVALASTNAPELAVPPVPAQPVTTKDWRVAKGDSLARIAKRSGVPLSELVAANPGLDPRRLQVGQALRVPDKTGELSASTFPPVAPHAGEQIYRVKNGDMLTSIARANRTTVGAIRRLNHLTGDRLGIGQELKLPMPTSGPAQGAEGTRRQKRHRLSEGSGIENTEHPSP